MRLKVTRGRISEVETVVHRKTGLPAPFGDTAKMVHDPAFQEILPPEQRRSRARLIAVAQSYFNTVEVNDGMVFAPFDEDCGRLENGISTTSGGGSGGNAAAIVQGCEAQFKLGIYRINKRVRERLFPLVDVERGIVVASGFFDHANEFDRYLLANGKEMRTALKWPNSISLLEAFRVRDGRIHRVEAVFTYVPYFMHSPWAGTPIAAPLTERRSSAPSDACDKACLTGLANRTMAALVAKTQLKLPWAETVRYSENNVPQMIGEGIWGTVSRVDDHPLVVADPRTGNVAWMGWIEEHGQPALLGMRLKAVDGRIADVAMVIRRKEGRVPLVDPAAVRLERDFAQKVAAGARMTREGMSAQVDGYYAGMALDDGTLATRFAPGCTRVENGPPPSGTPDGACDVPFRLGLFRPVERVRDRDLFVADPESGIAVAMGMLDLPARSPRFTDMAGAEREAVVYPHSLGFMSAFRISGGAIDRVFELRTELPYGMPAP